MKQYVFTYFSGNGCGIVLLIPSKIMFNYADLDIIFLNS